MEDRLADNPILKQALGYARAGIPVFPVSRDKKPVTINGFKDATTDESTIRAWFARRDWNLALEPDKAGWIVVDLDGEEGKRSWEALCAKRGVEPYTTHMVETPNGGLHLYFNGSGPCSRSKLGPKIDTRGYGGYVLVPPSIGENGKPYRVVTPA